jgi:murein DD-endopeptidase MepM/ murein hydrolase activator NlpD
MILGVFFITIFVITFLFLSILGITKLFGIDLIQNWIQLSFRKHKIKTQIFISISFAILFCFIYFFTGPKNLSEYPNPQLSPYRLPWEAETKRFVSQGNRSFTTHRDFFEYSWDFWMDIGTTILAARGGKVVAAEDNLSGIGFFHGNRVIIEHDDGTKAVYAHIRQSGALVKKDEIVKQGQPIAYSGMVGATINPHLHFHVISKDGSRTIPISFQEVEAGVPLAGKFYTSENGKQ